MGLFKKKKDELLEIPVSEKNVKLKIIALIVLLVIGLGSIAYAIYSFVTEEPGWRRIDITGGNSMIKEELIFNYNLGQGEQSATTEFKQVSAIYTKSINHAYELFDIYQEYAGKVNLCTLNKTPDMAHKVDPALYKAFELVEQSNNRAIYLAPMYAEYRNLFFSDNDIVAGEQDPNISETADEYARKVASFASDPEAVQVELLQNNSVKLKVSDEYRRFANEYGIEYFIDFSWLTNAFIIDYVADQLISSGYTFGNITSYDGYIRNLDSSGVEYAFNVFDREGANVYSAATAMYSGATAIVTMRDYPMSSNESVLYYSYNDGNYAHRYTDIASGRYKSSLDTITSYSHTENCAQTALSLSEVFIADKFDYEKINKMQQSGIYSVWSTDRVVHYNDSSLIIGNLYTDDDIKYSAVLVE